MLCCYAAALHVSPVTLPVCPTQFSITEIKNVEITKIRVKVFRERSERYANYYFKRLKVKVDLRILKLSTGNIHFNG